VTRAEVYRTSEQIKLRLAAYAIAYHHRNVRKRAIGGDSGGNRNSVHQTKRPDHERHVSMQLNAVDLSTTTPIERALHSNSG